MRSGRAPSLRTETASVRMYTDWRRSTRSGARG
jgi:hypothetical protein